MPFVSDAQRRKCFVLMRQANERGEVAKWDCYEFAEKDKDMYSPTKKDLTKKVSSPKKRMSPKKEEKIFEGPRGGKYVIRQNKKVYI